VGSPVKLPLKFLKNKPDKNIEGKFWVREGGGSGKEKLTHALTGPFRSAHRTTLARIAKTNS
jgi:hypothetical protein